MKKTATTFLLLLFFVIFLAGGTASADTIILPGLETPLIGGGNILDQLYGLGNLQRVDDGIDQTWWPANGRATAQAKFANFTQNFGYIPQANDGTFNNSDFMPLFTVPGGTNGIGLGGPSATLNSGNVNFLWALKPSGAPLWTSLPGQNSDSLDHMVTWLITGGEGNTAGNFVIAWEDLPGGGDRDFNDVVVEVSVVPIPAAAWLFGSGLLGLIGIARRKA
jgi:hypothetical protein